MLYWFREEADNYEVVLDKSVHRIHRKHMRLVKTANQLSMQDADGTLHVTGAFMSGAACAGFSLALSEQHSPACLREQTANSMGVPASNILCILPSCVIVE